MSTTGNEYEQPGVNYPDREDAGGATSTPAPGEPMRDVLPEPPLLDGHAVEARVYAEDPVRFLPSPGVLREFGLH